MTDERTGSRGDEKPVAPVAGPRRAGRSRGRRGAKGRAPVSRRRSRLPSNWRFSAGDALGRTFSFFGRHFPVLCLFAFVVFAPLAIYQLVVAADVWDAPRPMTYSGESPSFWRVVQSELGWGGKALGFALPLLLQTTVTLGVFQYLRGGKVQYGRTFAQGLLQLLPALGVVFFAVVIVLCLIIGVGLLAGLFLAALFTALGGMVVALIFGVAVWATVLCIFFVAIQASVVERRGPTQALSRSAWLTAGARWKIFGIVATVFVLTTLAQVVIEGAIGENPADWSAARLGILLSVGFAAVVAVFQAVCATVVYHDLRKAKEGVGVEDLMKVFE